jgi:hypothetical protein
MLLGIIGGLGGALMPAWGWMGLSSNTGDPVFGASSETEVRAILVVVLVLFGIALVAAFLSFKAPRDSGLVLIVTGGVSLVLSLFEAAATFGGFLYMIPFGFLVLVAGVMTAAIEGNGPARPQGVSRPDHPLTRASHRPPNSTVSRD